MLAVEPRRAGDSRHVRLLDAGLPHRQVLDLETSTCPSGGNSAGPNGGDGWEDCTAYRAGRPSSGGSGKVYRSITVLGHEREARSGVLLRRADGGTDRPPRACARPEGYRTHVMLLFQGKAGDDRTDRQDA